MDLSKLTWLELIELRSQINEELKTVENRKKIKAFSVVAFDDKKVFLKYENAKNIYWNACQMMICSMFLTY